MSSAEEYTKLWGDVNPLLLAGLLAKVSASLECAICSEQMHVPFITACGHSFCYECLTSWFQNKLNCPTCRKDLDQPPTLNVQLRDISSSITDLLSAAGGAPPAQEQEHELVRARAAAVRAFQQDSQKHSLFEDVFKRAVTLIDNSDGVPRCGNCHWEAHGSVCLYCGTRFRVPMDDDYYDSEGGDAYDEDDEEAGAIAREAQENYDSDDSFIDEREMVDIEADLDGEIDLLSVDDDDDGEGEWGGFDEGEGEVIHVDDDSDRGDRASDSDAGTRSEGSDLEDALGRFDEDSVTVRPSERDSRSRGTRARGRRVVIDDEDE